MREKNVTQLQYRVQKSKEGADNVRPLFFSAISLIINIICHSYFIARTKKGEITEYKIRRNRKFSQEALWNTA